MLTEGYRWADNGAVHFWQGQDAATGQYVANAPRAVFCRQWDWTFGAGQKVARTFGIFNDTHDDAPISFTRVLTVGGKEITKKTTEHRVAPGTSEKFDEDLVLPDVTERTEGELVLTLSVGGKEVFRDVKAVSVLNTKAKPKGLDGLKESDLAVFDPHGSVTAFLKDRGIAFTPLENLDALPDDAQRARDRQGRHSRRTEQRDEAGGLCR